jgi:exopolyphosphatase/guanosine-5'-triphosphate,3'-diphosphate pyrophosphatase
MRVGVVDVGSNTIRLLVARVENEIIEPLAKERVRLALGGEIERTGRVSDVSLAVASKAVRKLVAIARRQRVETLDVFLTAPGRQSANARELVNALARAADVPVRTLTTEEEGTLAYLGALATVTTAIRSPVAVCDVGGASTEIAVGAPHTAPWWVRSVDLGSVRLTARVEDVAEARAAAAAAFGAVEAPLVESALAVGGSARATRRLVGPTLGTEELAEALRLVEAKPARALSRRFGVDRARAEILPAGVALLAAVQELLGVPLRVCDGGIREGAALASVAAAAA